MLYLYTVIIDSFLVVCVCHQCLGLFHCANCKLLVIDAFECAVNYSILLTICFKYTFAQINILHARSLTLNHDITRYTLGSIVYHIFLIDRAIHLDEVLRIPWYDDYCVHPWKWDLVISYWSSGTIVNQGTWSCQLLVRNSSPVVRRSSSIYPTRRNQMICTFHTSCEQCYPCPWVDNQWISILVQQFHVIKFIHTLRNTLEGSKLELDENIDKLTLLLIVITIQKVSPLYSILLIMEST